MITHYLKLVHSFYLKLFPETSKKSLKKSNDTFKKLKHVNYLDCLNIATDVQHF